MSTTGTADSSTGQMIVTSSTGQVFEMGKAPRYMGAAAFTTWRCSDGGLLLKSHKTVEAATKATYYGRPRVDLIIPA